MDKPAVQADVDVLIVGAGLSGIGAACRLDEQCPGVSYAILEARDVIGGTWDLFRYPGVRSDSDMYSLGYSFRPWTGRKAIADGADILQYIRDTARERDIERHIRYGHRVVSANWSSTDALWQVTMQHGESGTTQVITTRFLYWCSGYYRYDAGYLPVFEGRERFSGNVIHPQHWDPNVAYAGKRVVVIGSGATAITLVPALAKTAAHVTMLQRSPTYIISYPEVDPLAKPLLWLLPKGWAHNILRWKNVAFTAGSWELSRRWPRAMKKIFISQARVQLPRGYDVRTHFTPTYKPWDQRLCLVPNGDLFRTIRRGRATVITGQINTFTEKGILLESGDELEADLIVTATGLTLLPYGGASMTIDGEPLAIPEHTMYRAMMLDGVPNMASAMGYTNASFTLKCDLTNQFVCRLLNHMKATGTDYCVAKTPDPLMERLFGIDLTSGFVTRSIADFPRQGAEVPWRLYQNYPRDIRTLLHEDLEDGVLEFARKTPDRAPTEPTLHAVN